MLLMSCMKSASDLLDRFSVFMCVYGHLQPGGGQNPVFYTKVGPFLGSR